MDMFDKIALALLLWGGGIAAAGGMLESMKIFKCSIPFFALSTIVWVLT